MFNEQKGKGKCRMSKKKKIIINTPCDIKQLESAINRICHAGGCLNAIVKTEDNIIIFTYEEHQH